MAILASVITIADVALVTYIITDILLNNVSDIADGSSNSSDVNGEARDSAIDDATKNTGTSGGGGKKDNDELKN